jgi:hypothetical protein
MARLMQPGMMGNVTNIESMEAHMANHRRQIAMQALHLYDRFVELDIDDEVYIAKRRSHCYAFVNWFGRRHENSPREWLTNESTVGIIPVHRIKSRFTPVHIQADQTIFEILSIPRRIRLAASYAHDG